MRIDRTNQNSLAGAQFQASNLIKKLIEDEKKPVVRNTEKTTPPQATTSTGNPAIDILLGAIFRTAVAGAEVTRIFQNLVFENGADAANQLAQRAVRENTADVAQRQAAANTINQSQALPQATINNGTSARRAEEFGRIVQTNYSNMDRDSVELAGDIGILAITGELQHS